LVPPGAQHWGTAPGQGAPLVSPMVQPRRHSLLAIEVSTAGPLLHFHHLMCTPFVRLLVGEMDVSRCILVLDTFILSFLRQVFSGRREYNKDRSHIIHFLYAT
jgi:hypothetical protein